MPELRFWNRKDLQRLKNLQTQVRRINQQLNYVQHRKTQIMKTQKTRNIDFRRARTRTLIALGGLVEKSGLTDLVGIELGQDLQKDEKCFENIALLFGALLELKCY